MSIAPGILARGPWAPESIRVRWREDSYEPTAESDAAADAKIAELVDRGSPSHDGLAARLAGFSETSDGGLELELQPMRWSLRLVEDDASASLAALCVTRDRRGRWLAGRRAPWLATWAGRWALGAGGAVEVGEHPVETLSRELMEEWSVVPEHLQIEALLCLPNRLTMLVGLAWIPEDAEIRMDAEHVEFAWWPPDPRDWPEHAEPPLRRMAEMLADPS